MPSISLPTALAVGSLAVGAVGAGVSALGAMSSAHAQSANAAYSAQVARNNATIAGENAEYAIQAGQQKAYQTSMRARARLGAVRTGIAANGIDPNTGSAADDQTTQRETGTLETNQVAQNTAVQAYGFKTQETSFNAQAGLDTAASSEALTAGGYSAAGGLLAGASSTGENYFKLQQMGAFSSPSSSYVSPGGFTSTGNTGFAVL